MVHDPPRRAGDHVHTRLQVTDLLGHRRAATGRDERETASGCARPAVENSGLGCGVLQLARFAGSARGAGRETDGRLVAAAAVTGEGAGFPGIGTDDRPTERTDLVVDVAPAAIGHAVNRLLVTAPVLDDGDRRVVGQLTP
jgi:hypothetical protein